MNETSGSISSLCDTENITLINWTAECAAGGRPSNDGYHNATTTITTVTWMLVVADGAIFTVGLVGNVLVMYVMARYARMNSTTNVYVLNLSIADSLFLTGMPMIMTTVLLRRWVFGGVLCRVFFALTCINMFTGTFTLTLMSADRFAAVWYPVSSARYRTPLVAAACVALAWILSGAVMSPVILYTEHLPRPTVSNLEVQTYSCVVRWPAAQALTAARAYVGYTSTVGFLLPVAGICVFYVLLVLRLRSTRRHIMSITSKRQPVARRSVTFLVSTIIAVFIVCWLPYWCFQVCATSSTDVVQQRKGSAKELTSSESV